ncbi:hypothetical protein TIFTF001_002898 [Ficus carica]|uniref:Uncharacterized protein n=1 Tax=Ficus carica TaxID=3494 RepID=A0AA87ZA13_FICCA|nr:hypothetical protein TIFTF001_002898 [Ficus carica]
MQVGWCQEWVESEQAARNTLWNPVVGYAGEVAYPKRLNFLPNRTRTITPTILKSTLAVE